jgi:hypothetical protein
MIRLIGLFVMLLSGYGLEQAFDLQLALIFLFGLFLVCSEGIFGHIMFVEREKVRSHYHRR